MPARRWRRDRRMMGVGQLNAGDARALRRGRVTARGRNKRAAKIAARAMMGAARNATAGTLQVDLQMGVITALIGPAAERLAISESLQAHGLSVRSRLERLNRGAE